MPILKVPALEISIRLGSKLTVKPLELYYYQYIYRDIARPLLKQALRVVAVSCWANWDEVKHRWEGALNFKGKSYQWIIEAA